MNFKYYDLMSCLISGFTLLISGLIFFDMSYNKDYIIPYIVISYIIGYIINSLGSFCENYYNIIIGGKPSDNLLTFKSSKDYTGTCRIKFYHTQETVELLKKDINDSNASTQKMFEAAKIIADNSGSSRLSDFNANYAFSRTIMTTMIIICAFFIPKYACQSSLIWALLIPLGLLILRYRDRGYYHAREVLTIYYNLKKQGEKINKI